MINTKETIEQILRATGRDGIEDLLKHMEEAGFYTAPCSGAYHLAKEGGLAEHSLNVYNYMMELADAVMLAGDRMDISESIAICAILHDLGKMGDHGKDNYVPNYVRSRTKNKETGEYDYIQSEAKPYEINKELAYIDHEIRSVMIAERYIKLTEGEEQAILWHNGLYGVFKYEIQGKETPLYMLLHFADMWVSREVEKEKEN